MTVLQEVLTPARFRAWLEEQEAGARVGYTDSPCSCPLACYVSAQLGYPYVRVQRNLQIRKKMHDLPEWARYFVETVDDQNVRYGAPVTREEALRLLEGIAA